jgi:hypothetical protein
MAGNTAQTQLGGPRAQFRAVLEEKLDIIDTIRKQQLCLYAHVRHVRPYSVKVR